MVIKKKIGGMQSLYPIVDSKTVFFFYSAFVCRTAPSINAFEHRELTMYIINKKKITNAFY